MLISKSSNYSPNFIIFEFHLVSENTREKYYSYFERKLISNLCGPFYFFINPPSPWSPIQLAKPSLWKSCSKTWIVKIQSAFYSPLTWLHAQLSFLNEKKKLVLVDKGWRRLILCRHDSTPDAFPFHHNLLPKLQPPFITTCCPSCSPSRWMSLIEAISTVEANIYWGGAPSITCTSSSLFLCRIALSPSPGSVKRKEKRKANQTSSSQVLSSLSVFAAEIHCASSVLQQLSLLLVSLESQQKKLLNSLPQPLSVSANNTRKRRSSFLISLSVLWQQKQPSLLSPMPRPAT